VGGSGSDQIAITICELDILEISGWNHPPIQPTIQQPQSHLEPQHNIIVGHNISPPPPPPAGQHFEIREEGDWWAAVPDEEWPDEASGQQGIILADFAPGVGDRRQEIVFIGAGMDEVRVCGHKCCHKISSSTVSQQSQETVCVQVGWRGGGRVGWNDIGSWEAISWLTLHLMWGTGGRRLCSSAQAWTR
jgi:hypothetical protein